MLAWIWLDVALRALAARRVRRRCRPPQAASARCTYFFHYELPKIGAWLNVVETPRPHLRRSCPRRRSDDGEHKRRRVEKLVWVLIYGGLFPWFWASRPGADDALGWAIAVPGAVVATSAWC